MGAIASADVGAAALDALVQRLADLLASRKAHAARTVVLLPYAQLMPLARRAWARLAPDGYTPRFETTLNWAARGGFAPGPEDLSFDRGLDLLTARLWLERAGLTRQALTLAPQLVDDAWQLAAVAAAAPPARRSEWAARARSVVGLGLDDPALAFEAAVARIAVEWAAASSYATDTLFAPATLDNLELLVVVQGLQPEPVAQTLVQALGERAVCWPLDDPAPPGQIALHPCADPAHEAERAAACVMRHLEAGRTPVALAAVDRVLTRRVRAMLAARGVGLVDETGWKLSTTRAAAQVMGLLRACAWDAASDEVIDWLKNSPSVAPSQVLSLEGRVRRAGSRDWAAVKAERLLRHAREVLGPWADLIEQANTWRARLRQARALPQWQEAVRELLQAGGQWEPLQADAAGAQLVAALGLDVAGQALWSQWPQSARRLSLADFTGWADEALEAVSFVPQASASAQVVVLPFNQLLGRRFAALVVPGCDEVRLAPSPEPPGPWTPAQREVLGLPSREQLEQVLRAGWRQALQTAQVDVLWRISDEAGEPVLASPLVQQLAHEGGAREAPDARAVRELASQPVARPQARAAALPVDRLSASAYEDLRKCPYRFFALRQLGLQEASEIDQDLDKRDFGNWVHEVLRRFHEALRADAALERPQLLDRMALAVTRDLGLPADEFLPFEAAWPQVRDGYLTELSAFEAREGVRFESAETDHEVTLETVRLFGRIDRIDRLPDGRRMVMDYKTEAHNSLKARVKLPMEDTQLAFYAALLEDEVPPRAAYVHVGERGETHWVEQLEVLAARDALVQGLQDDMRRIGEGTHLQALGEGQACEYCAARGLCRKDFWGA